MGRTNEEFEKQESSTNNEDLLQSQNIVSNENMSISNKMIIENSSIQLTTIGNDIEGKNILDSTTSIKSHVGNIKLKSIISTNDVPMYNVLKPIIRVNKQNIESMKYDIVTTVKNKTYINNENV